IALVPGAVTLESVFTITESGTTRVLRGNGIPNHPIGTFPIPRTSDAYAYYAALPAEGYANAAEIPVAPYDLSADLPMDPVMSAEPHCIPSLMTGIALTGGAWHIEAAPDSSLNIYDPNAALPTDGCFGHPYATEYHYHGYSWKCMEQGEPGEQSPLLGYALDGFGIYGPRGEDGKVITNAELDECHGRVGRVLFNGTWQEIYHYVLNNEYPYSIGCFRGTPHVPSHMMPGGAMPSARP
ncbi:MAG: YHYH protein, partial [Chloroflexota bacterium]